MTESDAEFINNPDHRFECEITGTEFHRDPENPNIVTLLLYGDLHDFQGRKENLLDELDHHRDFWVFDRDLAGTFAGELNDSTLEKYLTSLEPTYLDDKYHNRSYDIDPARLTDVLKAMQLAGKITENDVKGVLEKFGEHTMKTDIVDGRYPNLNKQIEASALSAGDQTALKGWVDRLSDELNSRGPGESPDKAFEARRAIKEALERGDNSTLKSLAETARSKTELTR